MSEADPLVPARRRETAALRLVAAGFLTPLGHRREEVWGRAVRGERAFVALPRPLMHGEARPAGRIADAAIEALLPARKYRRLPRYSQLVLAAAAACLQELGGERVTARFEPARIGVFLGTGRGPLEAVESLSDDLVAGKARQVNATHFQETVYNAPLGHLSIHYGFTGPCVALSCGSASGLLALEMAMVQLEAGRIDLALVGGVDSLTDRYQEGLGDTGTLAGRRGRADMAPFAADRDGLLAAEGAVFVALARDLARDGAPAAAAGDGVRLAGVASAGDGFSAHANEPGGDGFFHAVRGCCRSAGIAPAQVDLVLAAATGERQLDAAEWQGLRRALGDRPVRATALKALTGDMGAANALLALALCRDIFEQGLVPGTAHGGAIDPLCGLDVPRSTVAAAVSTVLIDEASWGGVNACAAVCRTAGEQA
jgi:3-oxoacyl-[acyl-carrier-protein] synthase II